MEHDSNYVRDVEKYFLSLAGEGIMLSSMDYSLILEWKNKEIPKEVVQTVTNPSDPRLLSILLADRVTSGSCSKKPDKKPKTRPLGAMLSSGKDQKLMSTTSKLNSRCKFTARNMKQTTFNDGFEVNICSIGMSKFAWHECYAQI